MTEPTTIEIPGIVGPRFRGRECAIALSRSLSEPVGDIIDTRIHYGDEVQGLKKEILPKLRLKAKLFRDLVFGQANVTSPHWEHTYYLFDASQGNGLAIVTHAIPDQSKFRGVIPDETVTISRLLPETILKAEMPFLKAISSSSALGGMQYEAKFQYGENSPRYELLTHYVELVSVAMDMKAAEEKFAANAAALAESLAKSAPAPVAPKPMTIVVHRDAPAPDA